MLFHPVTRKAVTLNIFLLISKRKKKENYGSNVED